MKYKYLDADKYLSINTQDSVLRPIVLKLPTPPDIKLITGYGKAPEDQRWGRLETPEKLQIIEKRAHDNIDAWLRSNSGRRANGYNVQKEFWKIIEAEASSLQEEIKWIKNIHWHMRYGYWFFNYGKPTWITPWHFFNLNFYYLKDALCYPEYRDRDRRGEVFEWYLYTATESFVHVNDKGEAESFEMYDTGHRVFFGSQEPKRRRGGATHRALAKGLHITTHNKFVFSDIIADTGDHAHDIYKDKLVPAWYELPIWIRPVWEGDFSPEVSINLKHPPTIMKERCLGSEFGYTKSSSERANDSRKLAFLLSDEEGKGASRADVKARWNINKLTMSQMFDIHGYSCHPSTVEEMTEGGAEYKDMFRGSNFYVRKAGSGQTSSGLGRMFFKAYDGADGFIDYWGMSVIEAPTEEQIRFSPNATFAKTGMGAKEALQKELQGYLTDGSPSALKEYRQAIRKNPIDSSDCWKGTAGDFGFNILIVDRSYAECSRNKNKDIMLGNFEWTGGVQDTKVFFDKRQDGKFCVQDLFIGRENRWKLSQTNVRNDTTGQFVRAKTPFDPNLTTGGADPFDFKTPGDMKYSSAYIRKSDGGGAVVRNYDPSLDDGKEDAKDWESWRVMCTYRAMPTLQVYMEDMLKMCVYYGAMINVERNKTQLIQHFINRGYAGYLLYLVKPDGTIEREPGVYAGEGNKIEMFNEFMEYIDQRGHLERDPFLLEEIKNIGGPERMRDYDRFAATGWALYGAKKGFQRRIARIGTVGIDISKTFLAAKNY
jgi:hypothetical protein